MDICNLIFLTLLFNQFIFRYEGEFKDDDYNGRGRFIMASGEV